jgi:hypothetical protein
MFIFPFLQGESNNMQSNKINLPDSIEQWRLEDPPKRINSKNIFDYMNGAGELYLGYHFDHLWVYEYRDQSGNDILVELYHMKGSNDAFGLLSLDWGGEADTTMIAFPDALYGKGLLRIWSNNIYARIMAMKETSAVRDVILQLGKIIASNHSNPSPPKLLRVLEPVLGSQWTLRRDRIGYFYSHLVLNSLYYLSHENILNLNHSTEAVIAAYEKTREDHDQKRFHFLVINYPDHQQALKALNGFVEAYLPDRKRENQPELKNENKKFYHIEDGWMGYKLQNRYLVLVFECPDLESAREIMNGVNLNKYQQED